MLTRVLFCIAYAQVAVPLWFFTSIEILVLKIFPRLDFIVEDFREKLRDTLLVVFGAFLAIGILCHYRADTDEREAAGYIVATFTVIIALVTETMVALVGHLESQNTMESYSNTTQSGKYTLRVAPFCCLFLLPLLFLIFVIVSIGITKPLCIATEDFGFLSSGMKRIVCMVDYNLHIDYFTLGAAVFIVSSRFLSMGYQLRAACVVMKKE